MKKRSSFYATTLIAGAASLFASFSTMAGVIITQSEEAATENLLYQFSGETGGLNWNGSSATDPEYWRDVGQTFKALHNVQLTAFSLKLVSFGTQALNAAITIEIYKSNAGNVLPSAAELVSTQTTNLPGSLEEGQFMTFTLDESVGLVANKFYTIYLHFDAPGTTTLEGTSRQLVFAMGDASGTNPLGPGGFYWLRKSPFDTAIRDTNKAMMINIYGEAIPETSAMVYLIGGGIALGAAQGWRRRVAAK